MLGISLRAWAALLEYALRSPKLHSCVQEDVFTRIDRVRTAKCHRLESEFSSHKVIEGLRSTKSKTGAHLISECARSDPSIAIKNLRTRCQPAQDRGKRSLFFKCKPLWEKELVSQKPRISLFVFPLTACLARPSILRHLVDVFSAINSSCATNESKEARIPN